MCTFVQIGKLLDLLHELKNPASPNFHSSTIQMPRNDSVCTEARLRKIDIPQFSGDYLGWISYRDMVVSLVHNNQSLSKFQKYYFLKCSCAGTPLDIINKYPASDASYELAWSALQQRYHNKRKIVDTLLKKLFAIPKANGSHESIKLISDTAQNCLALLRTMGVSTDNWDVILIYFTTNKVDAQSLKDLFDFLETTFRTLETINNQRASMSNPFSAAAKAVKQYPSSRQPLRRNAFLTTRTSSNDENCPCCERRHMLYKCLKFAALPAAAKRDLIQKRKICRNCFTVAHFSSHCRLTSRCHMCQQPHHTISHNDYTTNNADSGGEQLQSNSTATT
ncbi:uncharacterized protein LOC118745304 [Rhagoletis pomonella]|uniref:uncharacterized protein LOC118745304 n=1 Tax=Rhagoletis pomonella TaxID=28610 RepID=UPI00177B5461|nr:uncharacterized protein LOC118745304 [Rhagoletis pomonella]